MSSTSYFSRVVRKAEACGHETFYTFVDETETTSTTYAAFYGRVQAAAAYLAERGLHRGDVLLIFGQHGADLLHAFYGAQMLGAIPSLMPPPTARQDPASWRSSHKALLERIAPPLVLADPDSLGPLSEIAVGLVRPLREVAEAPGMAPEAYRFHDATADSIAFLQHSSGTTGLKKGVMVTYGQLEHQLTAYNAALGIGESDAVVSWLPVYHDMGLIAGTLLPFVLGLPVRWIHTFAWLARPQLFIDGLAVTPGAFAWLPNFAFPYLARRSAAPAQGDLSGVKAIINCSEPCKAADMEAFRKRFASAQLPPTAVQVSYAMAENVFAVTQTALDRPVRTLSISKEALIVERRAKPDPAAETSVTFVSCGSTVAGTHLRIAGAERDGDVGEIEIGGDSLCAGYYRNPELTAERFPDAWYKTGDYGFLDGGELFVTGRRDDLIIVRGRNLYAHDIEATVTQTGLVRAGRCVALGVPDERSGTQTLVVLAETTDATTESAVPTILEAVFSEYGVSPADVLLVEADVLIKTTSGKMSRSENLRRYMAGQLQNWAKRED